MTSTEFHDAFRRWTRWFRVRSKKLHAGYRVCGGPSIAPAFRVFVRQDTPVTREVTAFLDADYEATKAHRRATRAIHGGLA